MSYVILLTVEWGLRLPRVKFEIYGYTASLPTIAVHDTICELSEKLKQK
jgi:hypothetical protein